jgi:hypothetical protein
MAKVTEAEYEALKFLVDNSGAVLITAIGDKNETDVFGDVIPGMRVYKRLAKSGHVLFTEEEPIDLGDGEMFEFTPMVELTESGRKLFKNND